MTDNCSTAEFLIEQIRRETGLYYEFPEILPMDMLDGHAFLSNGKELLVVSFATVSAFTKCQVDNFEMVGYGELAVVLNSTDDAVGREIKMHARRIIDKSASAAIPRGGTPNLISRVSIEVRHSESNSIERFVAEFTTDLEMEYLPCPGFPMEHYIDEPTKSWIMTVDRHKSEKSTFQRFARYFPSNVTFGKAFYSNASSFAETEFGIQSAITQLRPTLSS